MRMKSGKKNQSQFLTNIVKVSFSNIIALIAGVVVGFIVPKILSVQDYGYYKTFTLYSTYIGVFNLGLADGIVLKYGDKDYNELDRTIFRSYFKWFLTIHLFFFILLIVFGMTIKNSDLKFIILSLSAYMITVNVTSYFQQISQITQRFKEYSFRKILQALSNVGIVIILYFFLQHSGEVSYRIYIILLVVVSTIIGVWYLFTYHSIILGSSLTLWETKSNALELISTGMPLLIANLCSILILNLDRQFVSVLYDTSTYATYAFAYNLLSLVTTATTAVSTVLYPSLKRIEVSDLKKEYNSITSLLMIFIFFALIVYFPLGMFINWFLPKYTASIPILRIVFPGLAVSSCVTVVMHNFYKAMGKSNLFFKKCVIILAISTFANFCAYHFFGTPASISVASIISLLIWYALAEKTITSDLAINSKKNTIYMFVMIIAFYLCSMISNYILAGLTYLTVFVTITLLLYKAQLYNRLKKMR